MQLPRKMSAQNVMASITRTLGTRNDGNGKHSNEVKLAGEESKDKLYEPKHRQKLVRVLTVVAYVVSVSLAAIILSLYYTFIWDPKDHALHNVRQNNLNSTVKIDCNNLTIPSIPHIPETNGSQITRVPTEIPRTEMEVLQNVGKKSSPENQVPVEIAPDLTRYGEPVMDSPAFIVPALVQPDYETIGKERK